MMADTLLLLSGGLDSVVLAETLRATGRLRAAVHFVYPHPAQSHERRAVHRLALRWHTAGDTTPVREVLLNLHASELATGAGTKGPRIVPARNLALLAMAANMAPGLGATRLAFGATREDLASYADCRLGYFQTLNQLLAPFEVEVAAPFIDYSRSQIAEMAAGFGLDRGDWWSCYEPTAGQPCGSCDSCRQGAP
jgi:7-cyano-7-deazaguanine synthase in queuosine biosynthesis